MVMEVVRHRKIVLLPPSPLLLLLLSGGFEFLTETQPDTLVGHLHSNGHIISYCAKTEKWKKKKK